MSFSLYQKVPDGSKNIYPKTKENVTSLLHYYFDEFTPEQHSCVQYILDEVFIELDQVEFIAKMTAQNYQSFFMNKFNRHNLKNFFKYMLEVFYLEEMYWRGSATRLEIMNSLRMTVNQNEEDDYGITPRIKPINKGKLLHSNTIFNVEIKNEVVDVTLEKFQQEFPIDFEYFATEFYHNSMNHKKAYKFVFEYRAGNILRFADYESNYFIIIEPYLFDSLKYEIYKVGKIIFLRIRKFLNDEKIVVLNIVEVIIKDDVEYLKNCSQDDEDYPTNEEWMESEFGDEAETAFWNLD